MYIHSYSTNIHAVNGTLAIKVDAWTVLCTLLCIWPADIKLSEHYYTKSTHLVLWSTKKHTNKGSKDCNI